MTNFRSLFFPFGIDYSRDPSQLALKLKRFDSGLKIEHLTDTLGQSSKKGFTEAFCFIWKEIKFNENARNWLEGAMDKNRMSIKLANGIISKCFIIGADLASKI